MRPTAAFVLLAAALGLAHPSARAEVGPGERPPAFEGKEFLNIGKCDLKSLRGHVVLLEVFRTWCHVCREQAPHMNEIWAQYKDKGLVVLGITNENKTLVDAFVAKSTANYPIVMESTDSATALAVGGYPHCFLIGPDGKIAWHDTMFTPGAQQALLDDLLAKQLIAPKLPEKLGAVQKLLDKSKYADARKALVAAAAGKLSDDEKKAADEMVAWIDASGTSLVASATADDAAGNALDAAETFADVAADYAGLEPGTKAADGLKALLADPAKKKEIDAAKALAKAKEAARGEPAKKALLLFKPLVSKWKGTKAGDKAAAIVTELEAKEAKAGK